MSSPPPPPTESFSPKELKDALLRPDLAMEYVLGRPRRLATSLARRDGLWLLSLLLFLTGLVFALPFGAAPPVSGFWKVSILFTGSVLICMPSLHVFATYLGLALAPAQNVALALLISSVAAIFTFGFFPIVWFITATTDGAASDLPPGLVATALLAVALLMGLLQLLRCLLHDRGAAVGGMHRALLAVWIVLLLFITFRMARLLELA